MVRNVLMAYCKCRYQNLTPNTEDYLWRNVKGNCKLQSFRTGRLEREVQMVQLSASRCSCIATLWVGVVGFVAITLCIASQRVFVVVVVVVVVAYFLIESVRKLLVTPSYVLQLKIYKFQKVRGDCHPITALFLRHCKIDTIWNAFVRPRQVSHPPPP